MDHYQTPQGFGCVEEGLYRASIIERPNLPFLESLHLKTLISLNPDMPNGSIILFAEKQGINVVHIGIQPWRTASDRGLIGRSILQEALKNTLNINNYPILILDSANIFIGILRKIQHWSYSSILAEYTAFSGFRAHYKAEIFLEMVNIRAVDHDQAFADSQKDSHMSTSDMVEQLKEDNAPSNPVSRVISLTLPPNDVLPEWYKRQQRMWEAEKLELQKSQKIDN